MTTLDQVNATPTPHKRLPWNKGKLTGAKPPLRPKHVWSIRTKLQIERRVRDLAMFNLAIDSKLRGCDVVAIRVEDVAAGGYTADRASVRQKKTGRPVRFELSEQARQAIDDYLKAANKRPGEFLFTGRRGRNASLTTRQYARLVSEWIGSVGLDPRLFGTFVATHKSYPDLSADRKSQGRPALARAYQDRKHGQVSRHRGRRCLGDSGTS
jgi:integrase